MSESEPTHRFDLTCPECDWSQLCDIAAMRQWLTRAGMLRRATDPDASLVVELFRTAHGKLLCQQCNAAVYIEEAIDKDNWSDERDCEGCGRPIPAARLEAIPTATLCAACQGKVDRGEPIGEAEYCERCGGIMVLRKTGAGVTRYVLRCGDCGR